MPELPVRQTLEVPILVDAIEHLLRSNTRARSLTLPWVVLMLSKLSIVSKYLRQLKFFQPWATRVANLVKEQQKELPIDHSITFAQWRPILSTNSMDMALIAMGNLGGHFRYPVKKCRSHVNLAMLQNEEAALEAFCEVADAHFLKCTATTPHSLIRHIIKERSSTLPWVEPEKLPQAVSLESSMEYNYSPFLRTLYDPTRGSPALSEDLYYLLEPKLKTHDLVSDSGLNRFNARKEKEDVQPICHVDKRAYIIFRNLFYFPLSRLH